MKSGRPIVKKGFEEHIWLKHRNSNCLATKPEHVGHRDVHGKDVIHWQNTNCSLVLIH